MYWLYTLRFVPDCSEGPGPILRKSMKIEMSMVMAMVIYFYIV